MEDHLRPPRPAPSEIRYKLPPSVFLDRAPLRSRKHPGGRRVPAWPLQPAKAVRKFQFDHANSARSQKDRNSTRLNSCHVEISYAVFCLKKKKRFELDRETDGAPVARSGRVAASAEK